MTDDGLKDLARIKGLATLLLADTPVTNPGVLELQTLENLKELYLRGTKVTNVGVRNLQRVLPKCRIILPPPQRLVFGEE